MSITHNIVLVKNHRDKKTGFLKLRTITNRTPKDKSLGIKVQISNWNPDKQYVYAKEPSSDEINQKLQEVLHDARGGKSTLGLIKRGSKSFVAFSEKIITVIPNRGTRRAKEDGFNKFKEYLKDINKVDVEFEEIDIFFVRGYYGWLNDNGIAITTANEYISILRYFVNQAQENGKHLWLQHPFKGLKRKKSTKKYRVLTDEELHKFMEYTPKSHTTKLIQQSFIFMMYAAGIRISDALLLTWGNFVRVKDNVFIQYRIQKTGTPLETKLTLEALLQLSLFIYDYYPELLHDLNDEMVEKLKVEEQIKHHQDELRGIHINSFYRLKDEYEVEHELGNKITWQSIINREEKKQDRQSYLQSQIRFSEDNLENIDQKMIRVIGDYIMKLRDNHPKDTTLPFMRGIYQGEQNMTTEVADKAHNAKVQFNQHLKKIQRKQGIKTTITNHQARHVFAQRLFLAGANIHYISMALGHSSLAITERYREQLVTDAAKDITEEFALTINNRPYAKKEVITTVYKA